MMDWQRLIDLGVMTPQNLEQARSSALTNALFQTGAAFSRAGAPSRTPGGQPLNLAPVFTNYQNSLANSMKQGLMMQMLERKEEEYKRKKTQSEAITAALTPMPVTRHVPIPGQHQMVTDLSYVPKTDYRGQNMPWSGAGSGWMKEGFGNFNPSQTVRVAKTRPVIEETNPILRAFPANLRPLMMALGKGGAGKGVMEAMMTASLRKPSSDSSIVQTAKYLHPGDRAAQKAFIIKARTKLPAPKQIKAVSVQLPNGDIVGGRVNVDGSLSIQDKNTSEWVLAPPGSESFTKSVQAGSTGDLAAVAKNPYTRELLQKGDQYARALKLIVAKTKDAAPGTGVWSAVAAGVNNVLGSVFDGAFGEFFTNTVAARDSLRQLKQMIKPAFVNNPKFPVAEQKNIDVLFPDPDAWISNPVSEERKMKQLGDLVRALQSGNDDLITQILNGLPDKGGAELKQILSYDPATGKWSSN